MTCYKIPTESGQDSYNMLFSAISVLAKQYIGIYNHISSLPMACSTEKETIPEYPRISVHIIQSVCIYHGHRRGNKTLSQLHDTDR